jgi:hypothetical protein
MPPPVMLWLLFGERATRNDPDIARVQMRGSPFPLLEDDVAFLNAAREWAEAQTILA